MKQIANGKARDCVINRQEFRGSNLYALWNEGRTLYVVYSYGDHHPLFVYDDNAEQWYENMSYASRTTSKHRTQTRPNGQDIIPLHAADMAYVARRGAVGLVMAADARATEMTDELFNEIFKGGVK